MNPIQPLPATPRTTRMAQNKRLLLQALAAAGAVRAAVSYSGGGDEGRADETSAFGADGALIALSGCIRQFVEHNHYVDGHWLPAVAEEERPLADALTDFALEAVEAHHGGWENGEGGCGEVVFDCEAGMARIEHNDYYVESEYTETAL